MTFLESRSVTQGTRERYRAVLLMWLDHRTKLGEVAEDDVAIDDSLCRFMTRLWLQGEQSNMGDYLLATRLFFRPEFSMWGLRKVPRAWRSLKGWRRCTPPRSRRALAWQIWRGLVWEFCRLCEWLMGVYILLLVTSCMMPNEPHQDAERRH